jgi:ABC-type glycerol-3-phosphate transport system substrate-binding protein
MKSKMLFVLTLIALIALVACAAPTPTPAPKPTDAPKPAPTQAAQATTAPTAAPATKPPEATKPAAPTATTAAAATKPPAPTATLRPPAITAAPGAVRINVWHHFSAPEQVEMMQKFADEFNAKNPQYYVVVTFQGTTADIGRKVNAAITANAVPEIATGNPGDVFDWNTSGAIVALDDYFKDAKDGLSADQLAEMQMKLFNGQELFFDQIGGKTFGISPGRSMSVMYYNADMLKAAGFNEPPATWDDFDKVCAAVTKGDNYCLAINSPSIETSTFAAMVFSRGGTYASTDEKKATFDDAAGVNTLKWLKNLVDKGYAKNPSTTTRGDQADFGNGKLAFTYGSTAGLPFYQDGVNGRKEGPFQWSIAPYPGSGSTKPLVNFFGPSMALFKTTADKQRGAWLFMKHILSRDNVVEFGLRLSYFPPTKSARDAILAMDAARVKQTNPRLELVLPHYKKALGYMSIGVREPISPAWQGARGIISNMLTAVYTGKTSPDFTATDPEAAAKEGVQRVNKQLEQYGK